MDPIIVQGDNLEGDVDVLKKAGVQVRNDMVWTLAAGTFGSTTPVVNHCVVRACA
jgi:hypothetical protein